MQNIVLDDLVIGAGPSALGFIAAKLDQAAKKKTKVGLITGADIAHPSIANSVIGPLEGSRKACSEMFGLPAIRAFGLGGTSKLWHGGLFFPQSGDDITELNGQKISFETAFDRIKQSCALSKHPIQSVVNRIPDEVFRYNERNWRNILIPQGSPMLLSAQDVARDKSLYIDSGVVSRFDVINSGGIRTRVVDRSGVRNILSDRIFIGAGCIGSMHILARSGIKDSIRFNDHLHVFAGVMDKSKLKKSLIDRLSPSKLVNTQYSKRAIWKTSVTIDGECADVGLGFRSVADPNFPRSGRAIGNLIGHRSGTTMSKILLGLKNPQTSLEMLAYKYGVELPFNNLLVHATVSLRGSVGLVSQANIDFRPNLSIAAACASKAIRQFYDENEIKVGKSAKIFDIEEIRQSIISGAQFSGSSNSEFSLPSGVFIIDSSGLGYTSIYNQTLLTLAHAYSLGESVW